MALLGQSPEADERQAGSHTGRQQRGRGQDDCHQSDVVQRADEQDRERGAGSQAGEPEPRRSFMGERVSAEVCRSHIAPETSKMYVGQATALSAEPTWDTPNEDWNRLEVSPATFTAKPAASISHGAFRALGRITVPAMTREQQQIADRIGDIDRHRADAPARGVQDAVERKCRRRRRRLQARRSRRPARWQRVTA